MAGRIENNKDMELITLLEQVIAQQASDIFIVAGRPLAIRKNGAIVNISDEIITPAKSEEFISKIYTTANRDIKGLIETGDDDFSFSVPKISRFRVNCFKQRGSLAAVIRIIPFTLPAYSEMGIPQYLLDLAVSSNRGMILVTGPAGSGKSTTLSCMIHAINEVHCKHIITLEDPVEYLHRHQKSIVSQREINLDTQSYVTALRAALRQSPDVILLGEMRDYETINTAMTAAETGHLLLSTLHTLGAANTIDRIIDVFPANQQRQIAVQLSLVLNAIVSQQLVPQIGGGVALATEIMTVTPAIRNMIRENKIPQIEGLMYSSNKPDMISMDQSLIALYNQGRITRETAIYYSTNPEMIEKKLK